MPAQRPIPRRLISDGPENGYESPGPPVDCHGLDSQGERRRNPFTDSGDSTAVEDTNSSQSKQGGGDEEEQSPQRVRKHIGFRDRVGCYTWTWFTMTMATGGIANVLHSIPYKSEWLRIIGVVVFLFNLALFVLNSMLITLRFRWNPGSFKASFKSPSESLFIPACVVSLGTILINMSQYGIPKTGHWFQVVMQVCFWFYAALSFLSSSGLYLVLWTTQTFPIHTMTPIWIFPAYPLLLVGPFAANLIDSLPSSANAADINAISIAFAAVCIQGTGFLVSLMIYSAFIYRLMTQKLPREPTRPGMFVSVGPSGFTVAGIVHLGNTVVPKVMPSGFQGNPDAAFFIKLLANIAGLWMWGLCLWFFLISVGVHFKIVQSTKSKHHIHFDMTWFSFVFPNTALVTATIALGNSLNSNGLKIFGTVFAVLLIIVWMFVFGLMLKSIYLRHLLWPGEIDGAELSRRRWTGKIEDAVQNGIDRVKDIGHDRGRS